MAAQKVKAADKQTILKKLVAVLKKHYEGNPPEKSLPIVETLLYAVCLEDVSSEQADATYERLQSSFQDLNEIRVSSISEVAAALPGVPDAEMRALRVLRVLQYVFEKYYAFELEGLRKKTLEQATKQLSKIRDLSPFILNYTLHAALHAHLMPLDAAMCRAAIWLGLVEPGATVEQASDALKPVVRKADAPQFSALLRGLATDSRLTGHLETPTGDETVEPPDLGTAPTRLAKLLDAADAGELEAPAANAATTKKGAKGTNRSSSAKSAGKSDASATRSSGGSKTTKKGTRA